MAVTYALGTESTYKAGANVSATAIAAPQLLAFGLMAEGYINAASEYDWSAWYTADAGAHPHVSQLLVDAGTCLTAIYIINYDMSGFMNIQEAVTRVNLLYAQLMNDISLLKLEKVKDFIARGGS